MTTYNDVMGLPRATEDPRRGGGARVNLIEGLGVAIVVADDVSGEEVNVTISAVVPPVVASSVTFVPTGTVAATDVQAAIAEVAGEAGAPFLFARKGLAESVVSSIILQDDDELLLSLPAASTWIFEMFLIYESATNADFKFDFLPPVGAYTHWAVFPDKTVTFTYEDSRIVLPPAVTVLGGAGSPIQQAAYVRGFVRLVGAGQLRLRWAQNVSRTSATIVHAESYLLAQRML